MPLQGTLLADFDAFTSAVAQAQTSLAGFETNAGKVESALTRMTTTMEGGRIVQQATLAAQAIEDIGGVTRLTTAELDKWSAVATEAASKLTAMGQNVPPQIQALADATKNAHTEWSSFVDDFKVTDAIERPLATAQAGLVAFADTLGPAGIALGSFVTVGGLLAGELISLGNDAEAVGASIGRMSVQFNIPVGALSDLRFAIQASGADFDTFGNSMFMFEKRLEENSTQVAKGLDAIGLSLQTVLGMSGDQQILAISDAMRASKDSANLAAVAFDLFGRSGRDMLPLMLKPLSDLTEESEKLGNTWSQVDVDAARAFTAEMNKMKAETEEAWTNVGKAASGFTDDLNLVYQSTKLGAAQLTDMAINAIPTLVDAYHLMTGEANRYTDAAKTSTELHALMNELLSRSALLGMDEAASTDAVAKSLLEMGFRQRDVADATGLSIEKIREFAGELHAADVAAKDFNASWERVSAAEAAGVPTTANLSAETKGYVEHLQELGIKEKDIEIQTGATAAQQRLLTKEHQDAEAATTKYNAAWAELNSTGMSYKDTVDQINPKIVEQAEYYLKAGNSIATVAAAFPVLSAAQAKALDEMVKAYDATYKAIQKIEGDHVKQAETNMYGLSKSENDASQKQIEGVGKAATEIEKINAQLTDDYNKQTLSRAAYEDNKLWESAQARIDAFQKTGATAQQVTDFSNKIWEDTAAKASQIDWTSSKTLTDITSQAIQGVQQMAAAGAAAIQSLQGGVKLPGSGQETAFGQNYLTSPSGNKVPIGPGGTLPDNWFDLYSGKSSFSSGISNLPRFAGGVDDFGGGLAIVGEKGPELVNLPGGSDVIPNSRMGAGTGGSGGVSITIQITQPFGTPTEIARAVADAQVGLLRGQGVRLPYGR